MPNLLRLTIAITIAVVWAASPAPAQTGANKGFDIAARADRSDRGFGDSQVRMKLVSRNEAGEETERSLILKILENPDENFGDRMLVIFEAPEDVAGTALLSHANVLTADDQWLYLPALGRVTRISSANKSGPFLGSEFSFEDFASQELNKFDYRFLREERCGDFTCDVVERLPLYEFSGYSRQIVWIDQDIFQLRKSEFYDRGGALLKTLILEEYRQYDGAYWRPQILSMQNHRSGKSTDLIYEDYVFNAGFDPAEFESEALGGQ